MKRTQLPAFDPAANPTKLRCGGKEVFGWIYGDGTLEVVCRATTCNRRGITRHLFNPTTGLAVDLAVPPPSKTPPPGGGE